jgi:hypothetical protein
MFIFYKINLIIMNEDGMSLKSSNSIRKKKTEE